MALRISWVMLGLSLVVVAGWLLFTWRRHRFRMSTKYLLITILVISVPMAFFGMRLGTYFDDRSLLRSLRASGISAVSIDDDDSVRVETLSELQTSRPISGRISEIHLGSDKAIEGLSDALLQMRNCRAVSLSSQVTDAGLLRLAEMPEFKQVSSLSLFDTIITDDGLSALGDMEHVETLWLNEHNITDAGLVHVRQLPNLEVLGLLDEGRSGNPGRITGTGLRHIEGLQKLRQVTLLGLNISDKSLESIAELKNLNSLVICECSVSDAGLVSLQGMTSLEWLSLRGTQVTQEAVDRLSDALPNCKDLVQRVVDGRAESLSDSPGVGIYPVRGIVPGIDAIDRFGRRWELAINARHAVRAVASCLH